MNFTEDVGAEIFSDSSPVLSPRPESCYRPCWLVVVIIIITAIVVLSQVALVTLLTLKTSASVTEVFSMSVEYDSADALPNARGDADEFGKICAMAGYRLPALERDQKHSYVFHSATQFMETLWSYKPRPGSDLIFFAAAHGIYQDGGPCLVFPDDVVPVRWIQNALLKKKARCVLIIGDACAKETNQPQSQHPRWQMREDKRCAVLWACGKGHSTPDSNALGKGGRLFAALFNVLWLESKTVHGLFEDVKSYYRTVELTEELPTLMAPKIFNMHLRRFPGRI